MKAVEIFNSITGIEATNGYGSKWSSVVNHDREQWAQERRWELMKFIPESSLAYKILQENTRFTDKQKWVIAYELQKSEAYQNSLNEVEEVEEEIEEVKEYTPVAELQPYDVVYNKNLGEGVIISIDGDNIKINFEGEIKTVNAKFAALTKVD